MQQEVLELSLKFSFILQHTQVNATGTLRFVNKSFILTHIRTHIHALSMKFKFRNKQFSRIQWEFNYYNALKKQNSQQKFPKTI
jgi:hypothetical protein